MSLVCNSLRETRERSERIEKDSLVKNIQLLKDNVNNKKVSDTLIIIEWYISNLPCETISALIKILNEKYKGKHVVSILYNERKIETLLIYDIMEINEDSSYLFRGMNLIQREYVTQVDNYKELKEKYKDKYEHIIVYYPHVYFLFKYLSEWETCKSQFENIYKLLKKEIGRYFFIYDIK